MMFKKEKTGQPPAPMTPLAGSSARVLAHADIIVHSMPDRFRLTENKADKAKQTGIIILTLGSVFLLVVAGLFWYFMFGPGKSQTNNDVKTTAEQGAPVQEKTQEAAQQELRTVENGQVSSLNTAVATDTEEQVISEEVDDILKTNASSTPSENSATTTREAYKISVDSDSDGLTDEEEVVFGSRTDFPQSDSDSYSDLSEVQGLYNPAGTGKITDNPAIGTFENKTFNYSFIYPKIWQQKKVGGDESVIIDSGKGQYMQIIVMPNSDKKDIELWYQEQFSDDRLTYDRITRTQSWSGVSSPDGMNIYLTDIEKKYIITLSYTIGTGDVLFYPNIFKLLSSSFAFGN